MKPSTSHPFLPWSRTQAPSDCTELMDVAIVNMLQHIQAQAVVPSQSKMPVIDVLPKFSWENKWQGGHRSRNSWWPDVSVGVRGLRRWMVPDMQTDVNTSRSIGTLMLSTHSNNWRITLAMADKSPQLASAQSSQQLRARSLAQRPCEKKRRSTMGESKRSHTTKVRSCPMVLVECGVRCNTLPRFCVQVSAQAQRVQIRINVRLWSCSIEQATRAAKHV
jgi:hypothetical protein